MKRADFLTLVLASVNFLKDNTTSKEKAKLGKITNPFNPNKCILGQMTGNSETKRAKELLSNIFYCDKKVVNELEKKGVKLYDVNFNSFGGGSPNVTENYLKAIVIEPNENTLEATAPFELFILMDGANTDDLVAYIKGEKETFEPTFSEV